MKIKILFLLLFVSAIGYSQIDPVNVGTSANDRTGDPLRTAMQKLNANDEYLEGEIEAVETSIGVKPKYFGVALSDLTTELVAGTNKAYFRIPAGLTVTAVRASLLTAQTGGSVLTIDIKESGTTILSTKITIDNTEKTSTTANAAAVISDTALADDAEITFNIDAAGDDGAGLIVWIIGY